MIDRWTIDVPTPAQGWAPPWPNVAEIAEVIPHTSWTLIGGLMVQLHAIAAGIRRMRPTTDVDMALHIETTPDVAVQVAGALGRLGYELKAPIDPREVTAHRYMRDEDIVDVLAADHAPPSVSQRLGGHEMVRVEGGTQALRRTVNARLAINPPGRVTISVPGPFGAVVLKAAAHMTDSRNPGRHLEDAATLLATIQDPFTEKEQLRGSDRSRLLHLQQELPDDHPAWRLLEERDADNARLALRILVGG